MPICFAKGPVSGEHPGSGETRLCSQKHLAQSPGGAGESTELNLPDGRGKEQGGSLPSVLFTTGEGKKMNQFKTTNSSQFMESKSRTYNIIKYNQPVFIDG